MSEEKTLLNATVCFVLREDEVLLGMKAEKIGAGCWNGYGGGIEETEHQRETAVRELFEETDNGIIALPDDLEKVAIVDFHNTKSDGTTFVCRVHFYTVSKWTGEPRESKEMKTPTWFEKNNLPLDKMMPADMSLVPQMLNGKKFIAEAWYGPFQKELLRPTEIIFKDSLPED